MIEIQIKTKLNTNVFIILKLSLLKFPQLVWQTTINWLPVLIKQQQRTGTYDDMLERCCCSRDCIAANLSGTRSHWFRPGCDSVQDVKVD